MDFNHILTLFLQGTLVAFVILLFFKLRKKLGLGVLYACLGLFQFTQVMVFILNTVYDSVTSKFLVSPGSSVFITITLFSLLVIYIKEDAEETKKMIYAILVVNILISLLLLAFGWNIKESFSDSMSTNHMIFSPRILIVGNITLFLDTLLLIIVFEFISKKTNLLFIQVLITMLITVNFDTLFFSIFSFWHLENLSSILTSNLIAKNSFTIYYAILFYFYLRYIDETDKDFIFLKITNVFKPLTYKQKFEVAIVDAKKNQEMYRLLTNNSNDIICLLDIKGTYQFISPSIKTILGYNQSLFLGKKIFSIVHKDDLEILKNNINDRLHQKNKTNTLTVRLLHAKGYYVWIEYTISPIYNGKKITSYVSSARDITKRVLANNKFKTSLKLLEKREQSLNEASKIGKIGFIEYNIKTDTYFWSDYTYTIFGINKKDKIPTKDEILSNFSDKIKKEIAKGIRELNLFGKSFNLELKIINKKNQEIWLKASIHPLFNEEKEIIGRRGVIHNITDYKVAQLQLENSKQAIQNSLNLLEKKDYSLKESSRIAKIGYWEYNVISNSFIWSDYVYKLYGLEPTDKIPSRKEMFDCYDSISQEKYKIATQKLISNDASYDVELKLINFKKEEIWVRVVVQAVFNKQNEIIGRKGIIQNITDSKKTQIKLEQSQLETQNSLRLLEKKDISLKESSKIAKIGYSEYDISSKTFIWSDYVYHIYGLKTTDKIPSRKEILEFYDKDSKEKLNLATKKLISNGVPYDLELKIRNLKKEEIWVRVVGRLIYNKQNKIIGRGGIIQNITENKKAQLKLEKSLNLLEQKDISLRDSSKIAKIGYSNYDIESDSYTWSDYVYKIFGLNQKNKIPSRKIMLNFYDKESKQKLDEATKKLTIDGVPYDLELKIINLKKEEVWIRIVAHLIYNKQNKIIGRRAVMYNITDSKKAQLKLENSLKLLEKKENSLRETSKIAKIGYVDYDGITNTYTWSDYVFKLFGISPKDKIPDLKEIAAFFDKESQQKLKQTIENINLKGLSSDNELKLINKKNQVIWIRQVAHPIYNQQNKLIGRRALIQDITERKKIMTEIEKAEEMYRLVTDNSNDIICLHNLKGNLKYISPSVSNILGYGQTEYFDNLFYNVIHINDAPYLKDFILQKKLGNTSNAPVSFRARHKNGNFIWLEALTSIAYSENNITYFVSTIRDITQTVLAQKKIQQYQSSLQKLTTEITLVEENQKKKIATNIHDHLSQSLVISNMKIKELKKNPQLKIINDELNFIEEHISEALANSRKITSELSPPVLYQLGIIEAFYWLLDKIETKHKIKCQLNDNINKINLNDINSILLYRSIQEILNNAIKYAKATLITLDLHKNKFGADIIIKDNGVGFNTSKLDNYYATNKNGSGFGLFTVKERIKNINGTFKITSEINKGTLVHIFIPLS